MEDELIRNLSQREKSQLFDYLMSRDYQNLAPVVIDYIDYMTSKYTGTLIPPSFNGSHLMHSSFIKPVSPKSSNPTLPSISTSSAYNPVSPIIPTFASNNNSLPTITTSTGNQTEEFSTIKPNSQKWKGQDEWVLKLKMILPYMHNETRRSYVTSPIDGSLIQGGYYRDGNIRIPAAYISHYIEKYNVVPSEKILNYVHVKYSSIYGP